MGQNVDRTVLPEKARESRLRRMAERQGLVLRKSRRRDPRALDLGSYWLIDVDSNVLAAGGDHGTNLDGVEAFLVGE
jgi:hypothetical protein